MKSIIRSKTVVSAFSCLAALVLMLVSANPTPAPGEERSSRPSSPASSPPARTTTNPVTRAAVDAGVLKCASRINQVSNFLTANSQSGVYLFLPQGNRDERMFSASFEIIRPDASTIYATASFAPNQEDGGDAVYDTIEYVPTGSDDLEKTVFKDLKRVGLLKKNITVLEGGSVKVFLMPAGTGCVVIKKELVR